ncbi:peptide chain release factor H [Algicola sagamiensis]|uniref:peptide chain release factor H n=1 Tax=Algicola sagamiensis TaxID=163869 RepID=UPI000378BD36|nr:peptide chain release factor H [Algicola sagamiensis]
MILFQLSAGQGPEECCHAVKLASQSFIQECTQYGVTAEIVSVVTTPKFKNFKSVLIQVDAKKNHPLCSQWSGSHLWVSQSPYRPKHKRKNWFFSGEIFAYVDSPTCDETIKFQACRASGAGGQHVNTTSSAVRATHIASGISVRVESERSQHANKRLAKILIQQKLGQQAQLSAQSQNTQRWSQHYTVTRGKANKVFDGPHFREKR